MSSGGVGELGYLVSKPNGTLAVIEAEDRKAAEAIAASDPYAKAGLFANVEIRAWNWVVNNPAAG